MKEYILGLDIGITSVGYGLIDYETREVITAGVRLFKEADVENNEGRRTKRGSRRLQRRRRHRIHRIQQLMVNHDLLDMDHIPTDTNPYAIRVKGLSHELTKDELVIALLHLAKRRGIHNVEAAIENDDEGNELSTKEQLMQNQKELEDKYVCEVQLERYENGKVRGERNRFKTSDFVKEARQLLKIQQPFHRLDDSFVEEYIKLIEKRREYFEGPGKGSPYGWEGDLKKWYELLMGRCTYFPEELRSVKYSQTATLFNVLNDLNNLNINRDENIKLTHQEKLNIINNVFRVKKTPTLKQIAKELDIAETEISGYRITKAGKPEFTTLKLFHDLNGIVKDSALLSNVDLMDKIAEILTMYQTSGDIKKQLLELHIPLSEDEAEQISLLSGYTGTHSLSKKCMKLVLDELWHTSDNQMAIFTRLNIKPTKFKLSNQNKIPVDFVEDFILSPVVKRSFIQSINVVNAVIKKYGLPKDIIIELARESNSADARKAITNRQKNFEATNKRINEVIGKYGLQNAKYLVEKIKLHDMQEGKCLYSLEDIPLEDLLRNPLHYEVDHIIPRSVAFDNSFNNKVLVKQTENSKKGNRTPYQYLNSADAKITYPQFKHHVLNLSKSKDRMTKKKREYLLEERDINKFSVQKEFINRNLVDTRYATRELMTLLKAYFEANHLDVKVKSINGGFTSFLRTRWKFDKERNKGYKHHAEDALIIANVDFIFKSHKKLKNQMKVMEKPSVDEPEVEVKVAGEEEYEEMFIIPHQIQGIKDFKDFKYSHRVDKKPNRQLINDTIYSTREVDEELYTVQTIKNIYAKDNDTIKKIMDKSPEKLLMFKNDPRTFEKLQLIMKQYSNEKNPLFKHLEETGEMLTKYSKKGNGPTVKSLKYIGKKVGTHLDITNDYKDARNKVIKLSQKPYRFDVFKDDEGYKFVTVKYIDVIKKESYFIIDNKKYKKSMMKRSIKDGSKFIGSFYNNDLIKIDNEIFKVIGVNSERLNRIEVDLIDIRYPDFCKINNIATPRLYKTITNKTKSLSKVSSDLLGNTYNAFSSEKPQMIIKKG